MLHLETVTPTLLKIIQTICSEPFFDKFRLVGGTGLSLQLGHRQSVDADFFSNEAYSQEDAIKILSHILPSFIVLKKSAHGMALMYEGVKLDIYTWGVPFLLPSIEIEDIRIADLADIAALKLEAIINRKEEKDFRDIHALLQRFSLSELLRFFHQRYPHHSIRVPIDHLMAASFVERDRSIELIKPIEWSEVTAEIEASIRDFYLKKKKERAAKDAQQLHERLAKIRDKKKK